MPSPCAAGPGFSGDTRLSFRPWHVRRIYRLDLNARYLDETLSRGLFGQIRKRVFRTRSPTKEALPRNLTSAAAFSLRCQARCVVSPLAEDYRREAEYAMVMADKAATETLRASWLRLAGKWLAMIPGRAQPSAG